MAERQADGTLPPSVGPAALGEEDFVRLRAQLARSVARVCPRWLAGQAEDIVQTAVLRVMDVLRRGEGKAGLGASYLWKVAYTATVDEIRRRRRKREVPLEEHAAGLPDGPAADPERTRAGREAGEGLRECLGRLLEPRRLAVVLHLQGHSVPEAARLLGWSAKRAENLVYRGLADLRACLRAKGLEP